MRIAIAWGCSLLGLGVMYVSFLGMAMSTAPDDLTLSVALALAILPLIALIASGVALYKSYSENVTYIIPFLISAFSLVIITYNLSPIILVLIVFIVGGIGFYKGWKKYRSNR